MATFTTTPTPAANIPPQFQDLLQRVLDPAAPAALKLTAARGALPLPPVLVLRILVALSADSDPAVADTAAASLTDFNDDPTRLVPLLESAEVDPQVLHFFGRRLQVKTDPAVVRAIVTNPAAHDATLIVVAANVTGAGIETLLLNEDRLSESDDLRLALQANPHLSARQARRLEEITRHLARPEAGQPAPAPTPPPAAVAEPEREPTPEPAAETDPADRFEEAALPQDLAAAEAEDEEGEDEGSAVDRISRMGVPDKVQLALSADREERMILVRDSNRLVAGAVLKSPKTNEKDVIAIAGMRNVDIEVLRIIGCRRDWLKNYGVAHALVENPKTPVGIAMQLVRRLNNRDLKILTRNKNISDTIRRSAKKSYDQRTNPKKVNLRGKK